ncbi:MAG: YbjQ family protein [Peptococcaceae bacterium]|nr:MAG: YbjQ family protein [Peptococcaceae bacterium]
MLLTTLNVNKEYEALGLVQGSSIKAVHLGKDVLAFLKKLIGGEVGAYGKMIAEARREAMERMIAEAEKLGANAVIGVRFSTSTVTTGAAEILAYGTAVKI